MESEHKAEIQALKYKVEDLESELRDLKEKLKEEVWYRKEQDERLEDIIYEMKKALNVRET